MKFFVVVGLALFGVGGLIYAVQWWQIRRDRSYFISAQWLQDTASHQTKDYR